MAAPRKWAQHPKAPVNLITEMGHLSHLPKKCSDFLEHYEIVFYPIDG